MLHISFGITAYILFITFILGCCLGSFADCMAVRLVSGQSVLSGRSHCDSCGHVLGGSGSVPCSFLAAFKGKMPLLRRKDPAGVLYHGADSRDWLLSGSIPV